jgi:uncharacterized protein
MKSRNTRSKHSSSSSSSIAASTKRGPLGFGYLAACAVVPLVALWPSVDPHPQTTAFLTAAQRGDVAAIDEILQGGLDVDCRDEDGVTPLMAAARRGQLVAVHKLLAAGAGIDNCAPVLGTPLMFASSLGGHHDVMHKLIESGADVNAANAYGHTALWYARVSDDAEVVRILTAAGAVAEGHPSPRAVATETSSTASGEREPRRKSCGQVAGARRLGRNAETPSVRPAQK